jgi:hypothetical protein
MGLADGVDGREVKHVEAEIAHRAQTGDDRGARDRLIGNAGKARTKR